MTTTPQTANVVYLVNSDNKPVAELVPVPLNMVRAVEEFIAGRSGGDYMQWRMDNKQK